MAISAAESSYDAAPATRGEYDVFLNFRGEDTRFGFTDFLYDYMVSAGVRVFKDEEELPPGEVISEELKQAIKNTMIYIPIFSQTYASSKWCLRELALMLDNVSESKGQKSILPIFFLVEPDDFKPERPLYEPYFEKHEKDNGDEVEEWKGALRKVDKHKGWVVEKNKSQADIVKSVVKKVLVELRIKRRSVPEHLVKDDEKVNDLTELLDVKKLDVRLVEIYGIAGMGKTTIAKVVFNKLMSHFGSCCSFLEDVQGRSSKEGIVELQKKLLHDIGGSGSVEKVSDREEGMRRIGARLSNKKVLVVLDNFDKEIPIKYLIGDAKLCKGSRIIITRSHRDILQVGGFEGDFQSYEMLKMDDAPALQLFCWHAFNRAFPLDEYCELSTKIVSLMEGLPLAIEVVGSLLKGKEVAFWNNMLDKLSEKPEEKILKKLRISYDDLEYGEQQMFLDIACFLCNEKKTDATYIWNECKFHPTIGIDTLANRCLIKILDNDKFSMHNQLINLGRHIVRQESPSNPAKQSRLWIADEALKIIRSTKIKKEVQAINVEGLNYFIEIKNEEFERLENLRLLKLGNGTYAADFANLCSKLRWISWHSPHLDLRGNNMSQNRLAVIKLQNTSFEDDATEWDLIKMAPDLKVLSLTHCNGLTTIPDFSKCSGLKSLTLAHCDRLKRIESFIGNLESLSELQIEWCEGLTNLPEEVGALVKLERFSLKGCSGLRELPRSLGNLTSLTELDLLKTGIPKLPSSMIGLLKPKSFLVTDKTMMEFPKFISKLRSLRVLSLPKNGSYSPEHHVWQLPPGINMLEMLAELDLSRHDEMTDETAVGIADLSCFRILNLTSAQICEIPRNTDMLGHLRTLNIRNRHEMEEVSELPTRTFNMLHQHASSPPELAPLSRVNLKADGKLSSSLLRLDLLSSSFSWADLLSPTLVLRNLTTLEFYYVEVEDIPLDRLPGLESLTFDGCEKLKSLTITLENLQKAHVSSCQDLVDISFSYLEKLESFFVFGCSKLTKICGLEHLESLKFLEVTQCPSLTRLIDTSCTNIPDDCLVKIQGCGDFKDSTPNDPPGMPLLRYVKEILLDTSNFDSRSDKTKADDVKKATPWWEIFKVWGTSKNSGKKEKEKGKEKAESPDAEFFEATGSRRQMRDVRIGHCDDVNGGKTVSMEYHKKNKDETGEIVNQNVVVSTSCQEGEGIENYERSWRATTEVEVHRDLSCVKRDTTVEAERMPAKTCRRSGTRRALNPGKDHAESDRARRKTSTSRSQAGLQLLLQERTTSN